MNELALFAGAGGGILATHFLLGWRVVCVVEISPYRRKVLMQRQNEGVLPASPIWDDIRTFRGEWLRGHVDVVTGGFPCQPFSIAGKRRGESDPRNLWPDTIRVIREVQPTFAFLENTPGLLYGKPGRPAYFGRVLGDLAEAGYDAEWGVFSAAEVGACHKRERAFLLAYAQRKRSIQNVRYESGFCQAAQPTSGFLDSPVHSLKELEQRLGESSVCRTNDGLAHRVDRLEALGDGQVPAVVALAWYTLMTRAVKTP